MKLANLLPKSMLVLGAGILLTSTVSNVLANKVNIELKPIDVKSSLSEIISSTASQPGQWYTYKVMMEPNNGMPCCLVSRSAQNCSLNERANSWSSSSTQLEDSKALNVYFKTEQKRIDDIFLAGSECAVDGTGESVYEIKNVSQPQSVSFLSDLLLNTKQAVSNNALSGIAMHRGPEAHRVLEEVANSDNKDKKHEAIFWLGQARNKAGYESLMPILGNVDRDQASRSKAIFALSINSYEKSADALVELGMHSNEEKIQAESIFWLSQQHPKKVLNVIDHALSFSKSDYVKKKAVFSLSELETQTAWDKLAQLAKASKDTRSQEEAIFWLSQNRDRNAAPILSSIALGDYSMSAKKKAVFAISQLESEQAATTLIKLLKLSKEKPVQKDALFWLGQSDNDEALRHLEAVLTKPAR